MQLRCRNESALAAEVTETLPQAIKRASECSGNLCTPERRAPPVAVKPICPRYLQRLSVAGGFAEETRMKRIAIIGGGISGLSAAFYLEKARAAGADLEYTLFESGQRLGGSMYSDRVEGCLVEAGPDSFLTEKPWALSLCKDLGIADQLIGSNDAQRKTYIVVKGRLVVMPDGLMFMVPTQLVPTALSSLFSWSTKLRMARELLHPPRPMQTDETVAQLVERHFGAEVVDRLADPLLSGVYGGDAAQAQRARGVAAFRRDGREVRQPQPGHVGGAQENDGHSQRAAASAVYFLAGRHAADGGRHRRAP